jgi:single-strand DNA-binding protein
MNLNKAMIIGNLIKDPEVRNVASGATVTRFTVATNFVWNDQQGQRQEKVEFHNVIAWRKLGEICGNYLKKGSKVYIEGRLQTSDWTGNDGVRRFRTEIVAENMIMLDRAGASNQGGANQGAGNQNKPQEDQYAQGAGAQAEPTIDVNQDVNQAQGDKTNQSADNEEIKVEDIPF